MKMMNEFIITKEYKRFAEFCNVCRDSKYIGLCYGPAGVGKSMSINYFANWNNILKEIKPTLCPRTEISAATKASSLDTVVYTPEIVNSPRIIKKDIRDLVFRVSELKEYRCEDNDSLSLFPEESVQMIIIDEADRLQPRSLEQIRDVHDRYQLAIIFVGMPGLEKRLIRFPQLYSRIGFAHAYKTLSQEEVSFILQNHYKSLNIENHDFTNEEAIAAIIRITGGNFRLLYRLLKQATRVMNVNKLTFISKEVIEAARECLVIGNI